MITLALRIGYGRQPLRQAAAWLIPVQDPRAWLAELLQWETPLAALALYRVPRSPADLNVQGVLAIVPEGCAPHVSPRCQPYARVGRHEPGTFGASVYVPVEARFDPDVADAEITELLGSSENVYLWHPACGLIGFEPGDLRRVADLLEAPPEHKTLGNLAKPGIGFSRRLTAIEPEWTPSAELALREGQEDIASRSSSLDELPPRPGEPSTSLLARMASAVKHQLTHLLQRSAPGREQSGGEKQSPDHAAGQASSESAPLDEGLPAQHPGETTSVELVLGDRPGDVRWRSTTAEERPPGLGRLSAGLVGVMAGIARAARQGLAGLMQRLAQLGHWFRDKMQSPGRVEGRPPPKSARIDEKRLAKRHREVLRLMHMLETDPDRGLRYAIPFQKGEHRGAGTPGSQLVHHDTDFSLQRLGGGEPLDLWDLPQHLREQLLAKYHELAGRELRLGRCRRAAYIYAELLGNVALAASALVAGQNWREAAVLYREWLHRADEAARCLEQGGLWTEAIALYEELGDHQKAGDLYRQLDQPEHAQQAYRAAVAKHLAQNDCLAAARLLENKLDAPDEALAQLDAGWSSSSQAGTCLEELFRVLARLGRHEAAAAKIAQLRRQSLPPHRMQLLIDVLSQTATTYPDAAVGGTAADATRALVGARLRQATGQEQQHLLEAVRRLVPGDRLLGRDCQRFLRPRPRPTVSPAQPATVKRGSALVGSPSIRLGPIREIELSEKVQWQTAVSAGNVFYAAGYEGRRLVVEQGFWDGTHTRLEGGLWDGLPLAHRPILLAPDPRGRQTLVVCVLGGPPLPEQSFPAADELPVQVRAGTPSWVPPDTIAVQRTNSGVTHVLQRQADGLVLHLFNFKDQPLSSRALPYSEIWPDGFRKRLPVTPLPLHARPDATYLALGDRLVIVKPAERAKIVELPDVALSLQGSWPFSRTRLVATMEAGAILYWDDTAQRRASFATELARPVVRFTMGGWLAVASAATCQVYRTEGHRIRLEADSPGSKVEPLAVLDTADPNQFALFGMDGTIRLYQMPHR